MTLTWDINWDQGKAQVQSSGGMLGPVWFTTPTGKQVQPFFQAPWIGELGVDALPGLLRNLGGEWPCVPFGVERDAPTEGWHGTATAIGDAVPHGFGANHEWHLLDRGPDWVEIGIDYPDGHPVRRLQRRVSGRAGAATVDLRLEIEAASDIDLGIAFHATFRLPDTPGTAGVEVSGLQNGITFPAPLDPTSCAAPGKWFERLDQVPGAYASLVDFSRLPAAEPNEDLVQVQATGGRVRLVNREEKWAAQVDYDPGLFPSVVLWITNQGWTEFPWSGRTRALGIEPARAAFDLGQPVSADPGNPISRAGVPTSIFLRTDEVLKTEYSISVEDMS